MTFKDLSDFDRDLIKSNAITILVNARVPNRYNALIMSLMGCIYSKGFNVVNCPKEMIETLVKEITPKSMYGYSQREISPDEVLVLIFEFFKNNDISLVKDENRLPTWSTLGKHSYAEYDNRKKPWVM